MKTTRVKRAEQTATVVLATVAIVLGLCALTPVTHVAKACGGNQGGPDDAPPMPPGCAEWDFVMNCWRPKPCDDLICKKKWFCADGSPGSVNYTTGEELYGSSFPGCQTARGTCRISR